MRKADGYYCQFCISIEVKEELEPSNQTIGLDVGLKYFYADSKGHTEPNPKFYRQAEKRLNRLNRKKSKKYDPQKKKDNLPQSQNYHKARVRYSKSHLKNSQLSLWGAQSKLINAESLV